MVCGTDKVEPGRYDDINDPQPDGCICLDCPVGTTAFDDMQLVRNIVSYPSLCPNYGEALIVLLACVTRSL